MQKRPILLRSLQIVGEALGAEGKANGLTEIARESERERETRGMRLSRASIKRERERERT